MNEKEIIYAAMKSLGWTQGTLAKRCGYKNQSGVSERLGGKSMRVDTFVKFLSAMGYEVVIKSTSPQKNKNQWVLSYGEEAPETEDKTSDLWRLLAAKPEKKAIQLSSEVDKGGDLHDILSSKAIETE